MERASRWIYQLVVNPTRPTPPSAQTNSAEITAVAEPDPNPANNKATATETPQYADLEVHKVTDKYQPQVGEDVTYTITLFNNGPDTAKNVELRDTSPLNEVAFKSALAAPNTTYVTNGSPVTDVIWEVPEIQDQETLTLTIVVDGNCTWFGCQCHYNYRIRDMGSNPPKQHLLYSHKCTTS